MAKGVVIGALLGTIFALTHPNNYFAGAKYWLYGAIGFLAGLVCGQPIGSKGGGFLKPLMRGALGIAAGIALFAAIYFFVDRLLRLRLEGMMYTSHHVFFGAFVGGLYGSFVELDDHRVESSL